MLNLKPCRGPADIFFFIRSAHASASEGTPKNRFLLLLLDHYVLGMAFAHVMYGMWLAGLCFLCDRVIHRVVCAPAVALYSRNCVLLLYAFISFWRCFALNNLKIVGCTHSCVWRYYLVHALFECARLTASTCSWSVMFLWCLCLFEPAFNDVFVFGRLCRHLRLVSNVMWCLYLFALAFNDVFLVCLLLEWMTWNDAGAGRGSDEDGFKRGI